MSVLDCAEVRDLGPEFAFGVLDGATRAEVVAHVERCAACRSALAELTDVADAVVLVAPEVEPPPGFGRRVAERMTAPRRRARWRTVKLVAGVAAAAAIVSIVTVRVIDGQRSDVPAPAVATVPMMGADGVQVGQVDVVEHGSTASLALTVDYALHDGAYRVAVATGRAARQVIGTMTVKDGRGAWAGVAPMGDAPTSLELVDDTGEVPCTAKLPSS